ncbi:MAG: hypothetical protein E7311_03030 [Clostridiales bacterium]|nr:hypothetical protein [Clostridiales bacterium]
MNKKFVAILLVVVILFNVASPNVVTPKSYALDIGGILLFPLSFLVSVLAEGAMALLDTVAAITGSSVDVLGGNHLFISHIVLNQVPIFNVNFFEDEFKFYDKDGAEQTIARTDLPIGTMQPTIAKWYAITRNIAIAAAFVILVYVAIKIFLSTAAGDKAKYKSLLKDWVLSLLLIFAMHYIMAFILYATDALTEAIAGIATEAIGTTDVYDYLLDEALAANSDSILYALIIWVLLAVTLAFIVIYAKRVIMIAFLSVFAPLVALSYSIDKIKDGQSQVLDKWMKEYIYNALMMPLDAILFAVMSDAMISNLAGGNFIFGLALVIGYLPLRGWFNEFLGTDKAKHGMSGVAAGAIAGNAISNLVSSGGKKSSGKSNVPSNETPTGIDGGGSGGGHEIETKSSPNPILNGAAEKAKVTSPSSAAVAATATAATLAGATAGPDTGSVNEISPGQRALQERQKRLEQLKNATRNLPNNAVKAYGKAAGVVGGAALGMMTTALTGKTATGLGVGIGATKLANKGNEYGLGGKLVSGTASVAARASDVASNIGAGANNMRDRMMVGGLVNAMAENGSLSDIEDEDERALALSWAEDSLDEDEKNAIYSAMADKELDEINDEIFRTAISQNKGEVKQSLADERMATRVERKAEYKAHASQAKAHAEVAAKNKVSGKVSGATTYLADAKKGRADFKEKNAADNASMQAKKREIKNRGK